MAIVTPRRRKRITRKDLHVLRRRQAQTARAARRQLDRNHDQLPQPVRAIFDPLQGAFRHTVYRRWVLLALAAILTVGGRTLSNLLRCLGALAPGHSTSYHRVFSQRRWSSHTLTRRYIAALLARFAPQGPVPLVGDDTVTEHPGPRVYGKGRHRDPVRSTHSYTAFRWGHKWVVLALLVHFPFLRRPWALPLMVLLYRPKPPDDSSSTTSDRPLQRHKTPADLLGQMLRILMHWFPERSFVATADGDYATHELAEVAAANPQRLTFVSRFYPNANLFEPPPPYLGYGRPRVKGKELPKPAQVVRDTVGPAVREVAWYGGERRRVEVVSGRGLWYRSGRPLVSVLWVFVRDRTGTHRDEYFFTTDVTMSPQAVIETYTGRWSIETTFQEVRSYLGLETTRGWSRSTVLRAAPCLFGLYTVVMWLYTEMPKRTPRARVVDWSGKRDVTFSDAITVVRRWLWVEWVFAIPGHREAFQKLGRPLRRILLNGLAPAA